jgi:hypothetical protein
LLRYLEITLDSTPPVFETARKKLREQAVQPSPQFRNLFSDPSKRMFEKSPYQKQNGLAPFASH